MRSCWYPSILACALICVRVLVLCLFQCGITALGEWEGRWFAVRSNSKTGRRVSEAPHQSLVPPLCRMSSHVNRLAHDSLPSPPMHNLARVLKSEIWHANLKKAPSSLSTVLQISIFLMNAACCL